MKLDQQKVFDALKRKIPQAGRCSSCGNDNWTVDPTVFEMREFSGGGLTVGGGAIVPIIVLTCSNCGHMNLLNAVALGLLDKTGRPI